MPALPPVTDTIKVSLSWILDQNLTAESILHFLYTGGHPSTSDCQGIAATIQAGAVTQFKPLMHPVNKVGLVTVLDIDSNTGSEGTAGTTTAGTKTGNSNPASAAVVMNHSIARRYRGGKPRSYAPFGTDVDQNTTGTWTTTLVGNANTAWSNFITDCLAATSGSTVVAQYISVSYFSGGSQRVTPVKDPIVQTLGRIRIGSQRRRLKTA